MAGLPTALRGAFTGLCRTRCHAIRHWSAEGGHLIEDFTAEDDLTPLPNWAPGGWRRPWGSSSVAQPFPLVVNAVGSDRGDTLMDHLRRLGNRIPVRGACSVPAGWSGHAVAGSNRHKRPEPGLSRRFIKTYDPEFQDF